ncbi:MAG: AAA family ATPase [Bacteriovoracaceae bacterium]|nr:AAA family ATPase [Bacteriovoracaceae bacterium]
MSKKFVLLFGPPAVGKMSVGRELEKLSKLRLFHNHMTIELVLPFFDFGTPSFSKLNEGFREQIIEEVSGSDLPGMIFTFVWDLDDPEDKEYIDELAKKFSDKGGEIYYVELEADLEERLIRNRGEERLLAKASKRDVEASEKRLLKNDGLSRLNSNDDNPFYYSNYLKIDSTKLSAVDTAKRIADFIS